MTTHFTPITTPLLYADFVKLYPNYSPSYSVVDDDRSFEEGCRNSSALYADQLKYLIPDMFDKDRLERSWVYLNYIKPPQLESDLSYLLKLYPSTEDFLPSDDDLRGIYSFNFGLVWLVFKSNYVASALYFKHTNFDRKIVTECNFLLHETPSILPPELRVIIGKYLGNNCSSFLAEMKMTHRYKDKTINRVDILSLALENFLKAKESNSKRDLKNTKKIIVLLVKRGMDAFSYEYNPLEYPQNKEHQNKFYKKPISIILKYYQKDFPTLFVQTSTGDTLISIPNDPVSSSIPLSKRCLKQITGPRIIVVFIVAFLIGVFVGLSSVTSKPQNDDIP